MALFDKIFGTRSQREIKKIQPIVDKILGMEAEYKALSEEALKAKTQAFKDRLAQDDTANGWILDGYPRNAAQVEALDAMLEELGTPLDAVVALDADHDVLMARIAKRAEEQGRTDDTPEAIAKRLATYAKETAPLLDTYKSRGQLVAIDGVGEIDAIQKNIVAALDAR